MERAGLARELAALKARDTAAEDMGLIGTTPPMAALRDLIRRVAPTRLPILVLGPSGTGKELVARALHQASPRADRKLVPIHCGAILPELLESELFGHLKGSFTKATSDRPGFVETAAGGTPARFAKRLSLHARPWHKPIHTGQRRRRDRGRTWQDQSGYLASQPVRCWPLAPPSRSRGNHK
jgi:hypothetical protein